jgi:hypothetical protein
MEKKKKCLVKTVEMNMGGEAVRIIVSGMSGRPWRIMPA